MLEPSPEPRVYAMPPGADFPAALVAGLRAWARDRPPDDLARVTLYLNTRRMARRVTALFDDGAPALLPRIRLIGSLGQETPLPGIPPAARPLRRKLEISQLVSALIGADPTIAPRGSVFGLADSLAGLLEEMHGERVGAEALRNLDVTDQSGHWERSLKLLNIVCRYLDGENGEAPDGEARRALAVAHLGQVWKTRPPDGPVIVAGSTGSRGTTADFMKLVAAQPMGALVLPGFDFHLQSDVWERLASRMDSEDHPQARFAALLVRLGLKESDVQLWPGASAPDDARNRLVSLALNPAPVTDRWLRDGPGLGDLREASSRISLIEAQSPRLEAAAVSAALRAGVEAGKRVALISPDRVLTRRVAAQLDRWDILADDSAGQPLSLSPPGRLLIQVGRALGGQISAAALVSLLKHPLANSGAQRGPHLLFARELELCFREKGVAFPDAAGILGWEASRKDRSALAWAGWVAGWLTRLSENAGTGLPARLTVHVEQTEALARGLDDAGTGALWEKDAGRKARETVEQLARDGDAAGALSVVEYRAIFEGVLADQEVRNPERPRPDVMIWGTLEARVQGADLVVLGGLNDGVWPSLPSADPWLNRTMRRAAGMLLPERRIGLAAHDFQQAIAAGEVVLSRAVRSDDAPTVPSRWLNRLVNLLNGLGESGGPEALGRMRARGTEWIAIGQALDQPAARLDPAPRPGPRPPKEARPRKLPVTAIQRLIRDPYAIYARYVLGLRKLRPIAPEADSALRGNVIHTALRRFMESDGPRTADALMRELDGALAQMVPLDLDRAVWRARFVPVAEWFVETEQLRGGFDSFAKAELRGWIDLESPVFRLQADADRIDILPTGEIVILDYKTGPVPSAKTIEHFDKQLLLEAVIAEEGGFPGVPAARVAQVAHVGLGSDPRFSEIALVDAEDTRFATGTVRAGLIKRISIMLSDDFAFSSRVAVQNLRFEGDYDHLARFGEWGGETPPVEERVG